MPPRRGSRRPEGPARRQPSVTSASSASTRRRTSCPGEGGAVCGDDVCFVERVEVVRNRGTDRAAFLRVRRRSTRGSISVRRTPPPSSSPPSSSPSSNGSTPSPAGTARPVGPLRSPPAGLPPGVDAGRPRRTRRCRAQRPPLLPAAAGRGGVDRFIAAMAARGISTPFHFVALHDAAGRSSSRAGSPDRSDRHRRRRRPPAWSASRCGRAWPTSRTR